MRRQGQRCARRFRLESLEPRQLLAANVVISEIAASNASGLRDNYGDESDWIELYNAGDAAADLTGWHLTDDAGNLAKWTFPAATLAPNETLIVFASSRDVVSPNGEFHTNFSLAAGGEYLGLVNAEGMIVHQLAPTYPAQVTNYSYGLPTPVEERTLIAAGATARALVPSTENGGNTLESAWWQLDFDDATWQSGPTGVGFERSTGYESLIGNDVGDAMYAENGSVFIRIAFTMEDAAAFSSLLLRMKYDDGFVAYLNGEKVASANAPSTLSWNSGATLQNIDAKAVVFEDFDISAYQDALRVGENMLAIHGLNIGTTSSDFLILPELVGVIPGEVNLGGLQFFSTPTPGAPNGLGAAAVAPQAVYSIPGGVYTSSQSLTLTSPIAGATIYYTTNGATPNTSSTVYSGPIAVNNSMVVKTLLVAPNMLPNHVAMENYTRLGGNVQGFSSDLPVVIVDSFGRGFNESTYTEALMSIVDVDGTSGRANITGPLDFSGRVGIRVRGSSSAGFPKQQYLFETWDDLGNDQDASLLDFPEDSDFILYAPYSEKSLMQNALAYQWSNEIGRYAVRTRYVEVYMNFNGGQVDQSDYWGVYIVMEKIKQGADRVDIAELDPSQNTEPDITGGYILKKDRLDSDESPFTTSRGHQLGFAEPDGLDVTQAQKDWIRQYMNDFETALYGPNFRDPVNGYRKYIDVGSFIDHHIMVEMTKNIDGFRLSTYMYKDRGEKLMMGPIWDYNLSLGNADYLEGGIPQGWYNSQLGGTDYPWYGRLFEDPDFRQEYIDRWTELRRGAFSTENLVADIEARTVELQEAQARNFQRWNILGKYVWPNYYVGPTWQSEVDFLTNWLEQRVAWIDSNWLAPPVFSSDGGEIEPGFELTITNGARQQVYYTTNGADPRLPGGTINPAAIAGGSQTTLTLNVSTRVMARTYLNGQWSGLVNAAFVTSQRPPLRVTEIMYHPGDAPAGSAFNDEDFEFIEFTNISDAPLQLQGFTLSGGVQFTFPEYEAPAGGRVVIAANLAAFTELYGAGLPVLGAYTDVLANSSDTLTLRGKFDEVILDFAYDDGWYPETDGDGYSLVIVDPLAARDSWGEAASWRASRQPLGTPGTVEGVPGDTNGDDVVDLVDLNNVRNNFGGQGLGDTDGNGTVDLEDLNAVRNNFGAIAPAPLMRAAQIVRMDREETAGTVIGASESARVVTPASSRLALLAKTDTRASDLLFAAWDDEPTPPLANKARRRF